MKIKNTIGPTIHKVEPFYLSDYIKNNNLDDVYWIIKPRIYYGTCYLLIF